MYQRECVAKHWANTVKALGPKVKTGRGARFIVFHAGGVNDVVPGGLLMFTSRNGNKGDDHDSMNHDNFMTWFRSQLLPNIPPSSLIIMDNASYHNKIENKIPRKCCTKAYIVSWLQMNNIPHNPDITKAELLDLVTRNSQKQFYVTDKIANDHGH